MDPAAIAAAREALLSGDSELAFRYMLYAIQAFQAASPLPLAAAVSAPLQAMAQQAPPAQVQLPAGAPRVATTVQGEGTEAEEDSEGGLEIVEDEQEEEDVNVYAAYAPKKVKQGVIHPTEIVETTSLAAVDPPEPAYKHHLADVVAQGRISGAQLETVIYANMRFNMTKEHYVRHSSVRAHSEVPGEGVAATQLYRPGFFLADGAGVGKGRQIAALIAEHWRTGGRRVLWLSVSTDLQEDAKRDVTALGMRNTLKIWPDGQAKVLPQGELAKKGVTAGVVFMTYSLLVSGAKPEREKGERKGRGLDYSVMKSQIMTNPKSRCKQIVKWLQGGASAEEASPLIVLDECHKAKNLINPTGDPTMTGMAVVALQDALPNAKVVYSSATGATEPMNLAYMTRIGHWGYDNMEQFLKTIDDMGLGAMEMLAMSLKSMGIYVSRTLSYTGATFQLSELQLSQEQQLMYNHAAEFWQFLFRVFFPRGSEGKEYASKEERLKHRALKANFWGAHMRFFRQMLIAAKVPELCRRVNQAMQDNKCCVIGLQSTGEAGAKSIALSDGDEMDDFLSAPKMVIVNLVKNFLPFALSRLSRSDQQAMFVHVKKRVDAWKATMARAAATPGGAAATEPAHRTRTTVATESGAQGATGEPSPEAPASGAQGTERPLAERIEAAKRTGMYVDLTAQVDRREFDTAMASARTEEEEEERRLAAAESRRHAGAEELRIAPDSDDEGLEELCMSLAATITRAPRTTHRKPLGEVDPNAPRTWPCPKRGIALGGGGEELHPKRLRLSSGSEALSAEVSETSPSDEEDSTPCELCQGTSCVPVRRRFSSGPISLSNRMLLCDGCDKGFHQGCLQPRLECVPEGDWFCAACAPGAGRLPPPPRETKAPEAAGKGGSSGSDDDDSGSDFVIELEEVDEEVSGAAPATARKEKTVDIFDTSLGDSEEEEEEGANGHAARWKTREEASVDDRRKKTGAALEIFDIDDLGDMTAVQLIAMQPEIGAICKQLLQVADMLDLPPNPLDQITAECGGADNVAEMTGRKMHLAREEDGTMTFKRRVQEVSQHQINLTEMASFMDGQKLVAIISDAASTGISLHADKNRRNRRQRVHFTLELPWSADKAIQQFGRSHRSNQVEPPIYDLLITQCGGERRFASCAARRLMSLGALTKGDRRAMGAGGDLKDFDIDGKIGRLALERVLADIRGQAAKNTPKCGPAPGVAHPKLPKELEEMYTQGLLEMSPTMPHYLVDNHPSTAAFYTHMQECCISVGLFDPSDDAEVVEVGHTSWGGRIQKKKRKNNISVDRFLNRLLGLKIEEQGLLFDYFEATYKAMHTAERLKGGISAGLVTLKGFTTLQLVGREVLHTDAASGAVTTITKLRGDKRIKWQQAQDLLRDNKEGAVAGSTGETFSGFYEYVGPNWQNHITVGGQKYPHVALVLYQPDAAKVQENKRDFRYKMIKPFGWSTSKTFYELKPAHKMVSQERAQYLWDFWYFHTQRACVHGDRCKGTPSGAPCMVGVQEDLFIVEGALLPIWQTLIDKKNELVSSGQKAKDKQFQVVKATLVKASDRDDRRYAEEACPPKTVVGLSLNAAQAGILKAAVEKMRKGPEMAGGVAFEPTFG
eukprot:jgi/Tetstr1/456612/TSEL_043315.t1